MKKMLKQNKGFSLVELLVAILIMAVIAGTAITLFSGVLNSSRKGADEETAESIKRAILTYMSMTNDVDLDCLGVTSGSTNSKDLIAKLCCKIKIADGTNGKDTTFERPTIGTISGDTSDLNDVGDASDINGDYGPFLDASKDLTPKTPDTNGWKIEIDPDTQVITVKAVASGETVDFVTGTP
jgi:type IV pilus assembly protein PilA